MERLQRAVGVLFSLALLLSCGGGEARQGARQEGSDAALESAAEVALPNLFVLDSLSSDKIGTINLGTVNEGEVIESSFYIQNGGDLPLVISELHTSCGCLTPEVDLKPIMAGEARRVNFYYDAGGKSGRQISAFVVKSSSGRYRVVVDVNVRD